MVGSMLLSGCGPTPEIIDTSVSPSAVSLTEFQSNVQFTIDTTVLHLGGTITSVTATIEDQGLSYDLVKVDDVIGGEEWSITTTMTLWEGFSEGTYYINITAVSSEGETLTLDHAASVVISS